MFKFFLISFIKIFLLLMNGTLHAEDYTNTSFYVAYDNSDSSQYALVMPSVKKIYTHSAGHILPSDLKQIDTQFLSPPAYDNGNLCFSALVVNANGKNGASKLAGNCYKIDFFYTQKEKIQNRNMVFILTFKPINKIYEGLAGNASSFLVVKNGNAIYNENSITNDDYTKFTFDIDTARVTIDRDQNIINITERTKVYKLGKGTSLRTQIQVNITPKNLYILFSNYSKTIADKIIVTHNIKKDKTNKVLSLSKLNHKYYKSVTPINVQNFQYRIDDNFTHNKFNMNNSIKIFSDISFKNDMVNSSKKTFYLDERAYISTQATARAVISDIPTKFGKKTLNVWVSDDSFDGGDGCIKIKCVTQQMVDALSNTFLKDGKDNDIYDWVTNIFGEEWGDDASNKHSVVIGNTNEITILLTDIDNDNSTDGGTVGYFYAKDNYTKEIVSGSNERIMFYIDSVLFATEDIGKEWSINSHWAKDMIITLAHEFQHMIHFYQKYILQKVTTDIWINEMLSEATEDVIATKIKYSGPRGVPYADGSAGDIGNIEGRYPLFNSNNTLSLTKWKNSLEDYSKVNAFGAYLTRNYGGVRVLHDIVHNSFSDENAIVNAISDTVEGNEKIFDDLLREWGIAILLSDNDDLENEPIYNTGDFIVNEYGSSIYELGSINFFNYNPSPTIYSKSGIVEPQGNYFYKIGDNIKGLIDINITLSEETEATLIVK